MGSVFGLAIGGRLLLMAGFPPLLLAAAFPVAFLWLTGYIIAGPAHATYLCKVTFGFIGACLALGAIVALVS